MRKLVMLVFIFSICFWGSTVYAFDSSDSKFVRSAVYGVHKIHMQMEEKEIQDENGNLLIHVGYIYPIIENPDQNAYIIQINEEYKAYAEKFMQQAELYIKDAKLMHAEMGADDYMPLELESTYVVNTNRKGILSITNHEYYNLGGAHPNTARISRTFDLNHNKELTVADILKGNYAERHRLVYNWFVKQFKESYYDFSQETANVIRDEIKNVKFYLTDDTFVLYFDVYQVAPYAMQYPTVVIPYSKDWFKLDWTDGSVDTLKIQKKVLETVAQRLFGLSIFPKY